MDKHIEDAQLTSWMEGKLTGDRLAQVESHLEECSTCAERLDEIGPPEDLLLERFREVSRETLLDSEMAVAEFMSLPLRSIRVEQTSHYKLNEVHSSGSSGRIWLAHDTELKRDIAFKELLPEHAGSSEMRKRFRREAQITAQLSHPGTVPLYDFYEEPGRTFYTMRFVQGRTFSESIARYHQDRHTKTETPSAELLRLLRNFVSVCNTIAFAHSKQIIHRDIKSENVLVGEFGEVIVVDWGIAKKLDAETKQSSSASSMSKSPTATRLGQRIGTPAFMSPEQALGSIEDVGPLSDVYGLAAMLYEILTGHVPFAGDSVEEVLRAVVHDAPVAIRELNKEVSEELAAISLEGLSKLPADRQSSAVEIGRQVEGWMARQVQQKRSAQERDRFFRLSVDLLAIVDSNRLIRQVNPAAEKVLGWTQEEMINMPADALVHPDELEEAQRNHEGLFAGRQSIQGIERKMLCKDGTYKWLLINATTIPGESSVYLVGRDITEYKMLQQRFSGLLEIMPDAVFVTDQKGYVKLVNAETERLFGYSREEMIGLHITSFSAERSREEHQRELQEFAQSHAANPTDRHLEFFALRKDGSEFLAEVRHGVLKTELEQLFVGSVRDISQRVAKDRAN